MPAQMYDCTTVLLLVLLSLMKVTMCDNGEEVNDSCTEKDLWYFFSGKVFNVGGMEDAVFISVAGGKTCCSFWY
jgi:hypothetical protein